MTKELYELGEIPPLGEVPKKIPQNAGIDCNRRNI